MKQYSQLPVKTVTAKIESWQPQIQATGTLKARQGIMLKAEASGRITKINVQSGQQVKAGDILFEINPDVLKAQLASAQAKSDLTEGDYKRAVDLYKLKVLSRAELDIALSKKNSDAAYTAQIKAQLEQNIIRAPISGKFRINFYLIWEIIFKPEQALVNLQAFDQLRVDFSVPANKASQIKAGDKIALHSDAYPHKKFEGKVTAVDSAVDTNTRLVAVRADMDNSHHQLLPGNFVQVTLYSSAAKSYVTVPQNAVVYDLSDTYVYIIEKNHAVKKLVKIIEQNDSQAAIVSGIENGDNVIIEGQLKIAEGSPVYAVH